MMLVAILHTYIHTHTGSQINLALLAFVNIHTTYTYTVGRCATVHICIHIYSTYIYTYIHTYIHICSNSTNRVTNCNLDSANVLRVAEYPVYVCGAW